MSEVLLLFIGAVIGFLADEVRRIVRKTRATEALAIDNATFHCHGGHTQCIVVVHNTSDSKLTLTAGMDLDAPSGTAPIVSELRGPAARKFKDPDGYELTADDRKTFPWSVLLGAKEGEFDLSGWTVNVHAGTRKASSRLRRGD